MEEMALLRSNVSAMDTAPKRTSFSSLLPSMRANATAMHAATPDQRNAIVSKDMQENYPATVYSRDTFDQMDSITRKQQEEFRASQKAPPNHGGLHITEYLFIIPILLIFIFTLRKFLRATQGDTKAMPKQTVGANIDERSKDLILRSAAILELQLILCKSTQNYKTLLGSNFARGYLIGFFDAAIQYYGIPVESDKDFATLTTLGHTYIFSGETQAAANFTIESMSRQGNAEFDIGQAQAGKEYFDYVEGRTSSPNGLERFFFKR
jgi:hypothetical protein